MDFKGELQKVADLIDKLIIEDKFPDSIKPEFLCEAVRDYPCRGGKRLRPAILLWSYGLCGGKADEAKFAAAAVEIFHNWTLVHDDIIDNDDFRRWVPTTHRKLSEFAEKKYILGKVRSEKFGRDFAILAGDLIQSWATNMMLRSLTTGISPELVLALLQRQQQLGYLELISGEALDVELSYRTIETITEPEIESMLIRKTGSLLRFCAEAGAAIALKKNDFSSKNVKQIGDFANLAGLAFQLQDDWLGLYGDENDLGKPVSSDLSEKKPTVILVNALKRLDIVKRRKLMSMLGHKSYSPSELNEVRSLITGCGAEKYVRDRAVEFTQQAEKILASFTDNRYRHLLREMLVFLTNRQV